MPMAHIRKVGGENDLYHVHFLDPHTDPGYGQGRPGERPDQGLPGSGGRPDQGLPGNQPGPDNTLPGGQRPGIPSNELPTTPPPTVAPGETLVLVRGPGGKWVYATLPSGSPPPRPTPVPPPNRPDQGLPPSAQPKG